MTTETHYDWQMLTQELNSLLKLKTTVIGMKLFESVAQMEAIERIRRPKSIHTADQIVGMAARLNWTVGATAENFVGDQCGAVLGLRPHTEEWLQGRKYIGIWHATADDAAARQRALSAVPPGRYAAMAVAPLAAGKLNPPDICLIYATPGQMIILINALQWKNYQRFDWSVVGETSCADSWGRALSRNEPSLSIPCFAERRYGGVTDDELLMALPPRYLPKAIEGLKALSKAGIRYPIPPYGVQMDVREGMSASY